MLVTGWISPLEAEKYYRVEAIIFQIVNPQRTYENTIFTPPEETVSNSESWPLEPKLLIPLADRLDQSDNYQILRYLAWGQEALPLGHAAVVKLESWEETMTIALDDEISGGHGNGLDLQYGERDNSLDLQYGEHDNGLDLQYGERDNSLDLQYGERDNNLNPQAEDYREEPDYELREESQEGMSDTSEPELRGWFRIYADHLLFAHIDIDYRGYRIQEKRRLKLNEKHFFDHPYYGILLQVSRLPATDNENLTP